MSSLLLKRLNHLKEKGFNPKHIYDVGAYKGWWTYEVQEVFPEATYYMFEANDDNEEDLSKLKSDNVRLCMCTLDKDSSEKPFYKTKYENNTGASLMKEQTTAFDEENIQTTTTMTETLQSVVEREEYSSPDLLKIDVQGKELDVLKGGLEIAKNAEVIILETKVLQYNEGAPMLLDVLLFMKELGYIPLDITELHYGYKNDLQEIDFLFVKQDSKLIKQPPYF